MSRKNHKMVDGRLLQTDKKYSNLKMKQKENINRWIVDEIKAYYKANGRMPRKEKRSRAITQVCIEALPTELSVCKVEDYSEVNLEVELCFTGKTDEENSLICPTGAVPENITGREDELAEELDLKKSIQAAL